MNESGLSPEEIPLIYVSASKTHAIEDCITFAPTIFKLNRSIVISEPASKFIKFLGDRSFDALRSARVNLRDMQPRSKKKDPVNKSFTRKLSTKKDLASMMKTQSKMLSKSEPLHAVEDSGVTAESEPEWLKNIRVRDTNKKLLERYAKTNLVSPNDACLRNFGVMHDFFCYSGISIQFSLQQANLDEPPFPGGIRTDTHGRRKVAVRNDHPCNIFQVAKVGLSNFLMPNTLDVKLSNFEDSESVTQITDMYFPEQARVQHTMIVFRPLIVKNEINELFIKILRLNNFTILKRKIRVLQKHEISYLYQKEGISESNRELYYNAMASGPCEIVVVSGIAAVSDAKTMMSGAGQFGRRRVNQLNESDSVRLNVNAIDSVFEISPFTSFGELFDLEDFLIRNTKIKKYKDLADFNKRAMQILRSLPERERHIKQAKTAENLFVTRIQEIRSEINSLVRSFNVAGFASQSVPDAEKDICVFMPHVAQLEEVVLVLNPNYTSQVEEAVELLVRSGFKIMAHTFTELAESQISAMFVEKYGQDSLETTSLFKMLDTEPVHMFHLTKIAADRECR